MFQKVEDLIRRQPLGVEQQLDTHLLEQQLVLGGKEIVVVNSGGDLPGSEILCQQGAHDVDILRYERHHRDEQVGVLDPGLSHGAQGGRTSLDRHHIGYRADFGESLRIVVDDGYVIGLQAQHLCQMRADLTGSLKDDFHDLKIFSCPVSDEFP